MGDRFKRIFWKVFVIQVRALGVGLALTGALFLLFGLANLLLPGTRSGSENAPVFVVLGALLLPVGIGIVKAKAGRWEDIERSIMGPKDWRD